ncbi:MAG: hypothetical protein IPL20_17760 [Saprospiraceae bacterium]|nr:hypothetical protein [Saprospiraceae bacterium]
MTFSEFGRTIYENGSAERITDTSAPMLFIYQRHRKGSVGKSPDLNRS